MTKIVAFLSFSEEARWEWPYPGFRKEGGHWIPDHLITDREKFDAWLTVCPVEVLKRDDCANGYVEVHVRLKDGD